jgi:hypothetical protein
VHLLDKKSFILIRMHGRTTIKILDDCVYTNRILADTTTVKHEQRVSVIYQQEIVADSNNKIVPQVSNIPDCWKSLLTLILFHGNLYNTHCSPFTV